MSTSTKDAVMAVAQLYLLDGSYDAARAKIITEKLSLLPADATPAETVAFVTKITNEIIDGVNARLNAS